jgi:HlyD family secretion protein
MQLNDLDARINRSLRRQILVALLIMAVLLGGFGAVAAYAEISGAVVSSGKIIVEGRAKEVQHRDGGIVAEILVAEGDQVEAGSLLFRLDDTVTRADLMMVWKRLVQLEARRARLMAERDGLDAIQFAPALVAETDAEAMQAIRGESSLFDARQESRLGQVSQLEERIAQLHEEVGGLKAQIVAKDTELKLIAKELEGFQRLLAKGLIAATRVTALTREQARIDGERGQLRSDVARTRGRISETELQILQVEQDLRTEVVAELREVESEIAQLMERKVAAEDRLQRIEIRAPVSGFVHELGVHTVGGVIPVGETLLSIVPLDDELIVETKVMPNDVDQVFGNQSARLRLTGLDQRQTPELSANVIDVSPDLSTDAQTGATYYVVRLRIDEAEIAKVGRDQLRPGMPVEALLQTNDRSILSYLTKPFVDQMAHAMREG